MSDRRTSRQFVATTTIQRAALLILLIVVVALHLYLQAADRASIASTRLVILVIGDYHDSNDYVHDVWAAVQATAGRDSFTPIQRVALSVKRFTTSPCLDANGTLRKPRQLRWQLLRCLAEHHVIAAIDASTTHVAPLIIDTLDLFEIPVLLTVATNDELLSGNRSNVLRLVANDSQQAITIEEWAAQFDIISILYDDSSYGRSLYRTLLKRHDTGKPILTSYSFRSDTNLVDLFARIADLRHRLELESSYKHGIIYIGYNDRISELLHPRALFMADTPLLLSDGAYSKNLPATALLKGNEVLTFPVDPFSNPPARGFGDFGHDAYRLIVVGLDRLVAAKASRVRLLDFIRDYAVAAQQEAIDNQPPAQHGHLTQRAQPFLRHDYQFDSSGQNVLASFMPILLNQNEGTSP